MRLHLYLQRLLLAAAVGLLYLPAVAMLARHAPGRAGDLARHASQTLLGSPLHGNTAPELPRKAHRLDTWLDGTIQRALTGWYGRSFDGRPILVKVNNQVNYSLFSKSYMYGETILVGRRAELYERHYLDDYCNITPGKSPQELEELAANIRELQRRLDKRHIPFFLVITPSKAAIVPEKIPVVFLAQKTGAPTSYQLLKPILERQGVAYVDGHQLTSAMRSADPSPLFCAGATHWSAYCASATVNDLLQKLSAYTKTPPIQVRTDSIRIDDSPELLDEDLSNMLNLLFEPRFRATHVDLSLSPAHPKRFNKAIIVGGSFDFQMIDILDRFRVFRRIDFYFYYSGWFAAYPGGKPQPVDVTKRDWRHELETADLVVLEINESVIGTGGETHYNAFLRDALKAVPP